MSIASDTSTNEPVPSLSQNLQGPTASRKSVVTKSRSRRCRDPRLPPRCSGARTSPQPVSPPQRHPWHPQGLSRGVGCIPRLKRPRSSRCCCRGSDPRCRRHQSPLQQCPPASQKRGPATGSFAAPSRTQHRCSNRHEVGLPGPDGSAAARSHQPHKPHSHPEPRQLPGAPGAPRISSAAALRRKRLVKLNLEFGWGLQPEPKDLTAVLSVGVTSTGKMNSATDSGLYFVSRSSSWSLSVARSGTFACGWSTGYNAGA